MDRIAILQQFINEEPNEPFNHYALALEYVKLGDNIGAERCFRHVLDHHPSYLPNYFHFGKLQENLGHSEEAKRVYALGIQLAIQTSDHKTAAELQSALDLLD